jgi:hypothetical protein
MESLLSHSHAQAPARGEFQYTAATAQLAQIQLRRAKSLTKGLLHVFDPIQLSTLESMPEAGTEAILNQSGRNPDPDIPRAGVTDIHRNTLLFVASYINAIGAWCRPFSHCNELK